MRVGPVLLEGSVLTCLDSGPCCTLDCASVWVGSASVCFQSALVLKIHARTRPVSGGQECASGPWVVAVDGVAGDLCLGRSWFSRDHL